MKKYCLTKRAKRQIKEVVNKIIITIIQVVLGALMLGAILYLIYITTTPEAVAKALAYLFLFLGGFVLIGGFIKGIFLMKNWLKNSIMECEE